jgi:hypothetical protein
MILRIEKAQKSALLKLTIVGLGCIAKRLNGKYRINNIDTSPRAECNRQARSRNQLPWVQRGVGL